MRWEDLKGTENTRPVIARNFVVATVAPPTKQTEVCRPNAAAAADCGSGCRRPAARAGGGTGARRCGGTRRG